MALGVFDAPPTGTAAELARAGRTYRWKVGAACAVAAAAGAAASQISSSKGALLLSLVLVVLMAFWVGGRIARSYGNAAATLMTAGNALQREVIPVWQRSVEAARMESDRSMSELLQSFAHVYTELDQVLVNGGGPMTRESGARDLQRELDKMSVGMQSHDRLSQMLSCATDDMGRYLRWLGGENDPAAAAPGLWLRRLESTYTMEDMRSSHQSTAQVDRVPAVDFF